MERGVFAFARAANADHSDLIIKLAARYKLQAQIVLSNWPQRAFFSRKKAPKSKGRIAMRMAASALLLAQSIILALSIIPLRADPSQHGSKDEAVAMVQRVEDMFNKEGAAATFKAVSDPSTKAFHDRDLYPFIYDLSGVCVAHGARPALIGKNLIDIKDQDGNYLIREMIDLVKGPGSGWVDYKWPTPQTNRIEDKSSYVEKLGDNYFVGVGIYRE
jgi:cytochrome c